MPRLPAGSLALVMFTSSLLLGCRAVEAIFKAGVWMGVIGAVLVVMLILGLLRMVKGS